MHPQLAAEGLDLLLEARTIQLPRASRAFRRGFATLAQDSRHSRNAASRNGEHGTPVGRAVTDKLGGRIRNILRRLP